MRSPVFTVASVGSLGIAIGLTCAVFAVARAVFLQPVGYPQPETLVELWETTAPGSDHLADYVQPGRLAEWTAAEWRTLEGVAGVSMGVSLVERTADGPKRLEAFPIVGDWFGILGVPAERGRVLVPEDLAPGSLPAAVVSARLAKERDLELGAVLDLAGVSFTVVGVMPDAFSMDVAVWLPAEALPDERPVAYAGVARSRPDRTVESINLELDQRVRSELAADLDRFGGQGVIAKPLGAQASRPDQPAIWLLIGVVGAVLLLGVSNLTQLFLVRAQSRVQGLAVRSALGGSRWRVTSGLAAEAALVGLMGAVLGIASAPWAIHWVARYLASSRPLPSVPAVDPEMALLAFALGTLTALIVGLEPARRIGTLDVQALLQRRAGGATSTRSERRTRDALVAAQIATAIVLATGTVIALAAHRTVSEADTGYDARAIVQAEPDWALLDMAVSEQWEIARRAIERLEGDPTVAAVGAWQMVMQDYPPRPEGDVQRDGPPSMDEDLWWPSSQERVTSGTLELLGIPLVEGRTILESDVAGSAPVAVVSRMTAEMLWPRESALGHQVRFGQGGVWRAVVGVTEDAHRLDYLGRYLAAAGQRNPRIFVPVAQAPDALPGWREFGCCVGVRIGVRARAGTEDARAALRQALSAVERELPMVELATLHELQMASYMPNAITTTGVMIGLGAIVAVALSLIGIVSVVAEGLARRTRELGLRMALGASWHRVVGTVAAEALKVATVGVLVGVVGVVALDAAVDRYVAYSLLLRMGGDLLHPRLLGVGCASVLGLTVVASLVSARRATGVDPAVALRSE